MLNSAMESQVELPSTSFSTHRYRTFFYWRYRNCATIESSL